jgi:hypothetical protein
MFRRGSGSTIRFCALRSRLESIVTCWIKIYLFAHKRIDCVIYVHLFVWGPSSKVGD